MAALDNRELYQLFDSSPVGTFQVGPEGRFVYANPALLSTVGYTRDQLLGLELATLCVDEAPCNVMLAEARARGVIDPTKLRWKVRNGGEVVVMVTGHSTSEAANAGFAGTILDITETEHQRDQLERTAQALAMIPVVHYQVDHDLRIVSADGPVERILGYPRDRWIDSTLYDVRATEGGSTDSVAQHRRALAGETLSYLTRYRDKDLSLTIGPFWRDGKIVGAIGTALDVTALSALERRMVDAQRAESLGVLAGGLAHDFNNLLVAIVGNADLGLREAQPGAPGRAALENIRSAGLRAAELTDQLLAYAGRGARSATPVLPRELVEELVQISAPTMPDNVEVVLDIPDTLVMLGEPANVRQVVLNLIGNACDALSSRGGTIEVRGREVSRYGGGDSDDIITPSAGNYIELSVHDNGPGIDVETRRRIFEPFFSTKSSGHGLGLAAVLGIVKSGGGGLRLVSSVGTGARFEVLWPALTEADESDAPGPAGDARKVLVIDDEDLVRDVVARMIEDLGYEVSTAADGPSGLALLDRHANIDVVFVDLTMPNMSGTDVVAAIRTRHPSVSIVLCSGYDRDRQATAQADAFLPKPFRMEALEQILENITHGSTEG